MGMLMGMFVATRRAKEGQEHQAPAVKTGEHRRDNQHPEGIASHCSGVGTLNHRILRQEPGKPVMRERNTHTRNRQRPNHHGPERIGQLFAQTTIIAHILLVMHAVNDRTGTQKQHRFKKGMGQKVEHCHGIDTQARSHEHIAQL